MKSSAVYYTGDTVPLRFTVTDSSGAVNPSAATVQILKPNKQITNAVSATVAGNIVSYNVPGSVTDAGGAYSTYFVTTLSYGERTHKIEFVVVVNPGG